MVAPLALGTFNFGQSTDEDEAHAMVRTALEHGINLFDVANSYNGGSSEAILGRALKAYAQRDDVLIATKVHYPVGDGPNDRGNSRLHIVRECERSLKRLGVEHIDLLQIHRPDFDHPVDESLQALTDLVRQGKVRYIGCSTHPAWKVMEAIAVSEARGLARYVTEQPPYNLLDRRVENELLPMCRAHGIGLLPYAPLAQGVLAGRYDTQDGSRPADSRAVRRGGAYADRVNERGIDVGRRLLVLARERGMTAAQAAMLWVKDRPGVTAPIFGPRTLEQLQEVLPVLEMRADEAFNAACDEIVPPGSAVTNFHNGCTWMKQQLMV